MVISFNLPVTLLGALLEGASRLCIDAKCMPWVKRLCWWLSGGPRTSCCTSLKDLLLWKYKSSILHFYQKRIILQKVILAELILNVLSNCETCFLLSELWKMDGFLKLFSFFFYYYSVNSNDWMIDGDHGYTHVKPNCWFHGNLVKMAKTACLWAYMLIIDQLLDWMLQTAFLSF